MYQALSAASRCEICAALRASRCASPEKWRSDRRTDGPTDVLRPEFVLVESRILSPIPRPLSSTSRVNSGLNSMRFTLVEAEELEIEKSTKYVLVSLAATCVTITAKCVTTVAAYVTITAECVTIAAEYVTITAECVTIAAECVTITAECVTTTAECVTITAECVTIKAF
jgi:hypothetical protein